MSIRSSCRGCVFARFYDGLQLDCRLGRLDKFKQRGVAITTEANEGGIFPCVIDRFCAANRNTEWAEGLSEGERAKRVREEIAVRCHVYIPALDSSREEIETTLKSLVIQFPKPSTVEILVRGKKKPGELILWMQHIFPDDLNWKVSLVTSDEATPDSSIDSVIHLCQESFYTVFQAGTEAPADFLNELDRLVNDELYAFAAIPPLDEMGNGLVILTEMHKRLGGNEVCDMAEVGEEDKTEEELKNIPATPVQGILNKIRFLAEKMGADNLILERESV